MPTSYVQLTNPAFPKLWSNETPSRRRCMTIRIRCSSKQGKSPLLGGAGTVLGQRCQHSWSTSTRVYDAWQRSAVQKPVLSLSVFPLIHLASGFKTAIPACYSALGKCAPSRVAFARRGIRAASPREGRRLHRLLSWPVADRSEFDSTSPIAGTTTIVSDGQHLNLLVSLDRKSVV